MKKMIEYMDHEEYNVVVLGSSGEDEVVEVSLPTKTQNKRKSNPTITIESSDEDEYCIVSLKDSPTKTDSKSKHKSNNGNRAASVSRHIDKHGFDNMNLHMSEFLDYLVKNTPSKKKKKKKKAVTTPVKHPAMKSAKAADKKSKAIKKKKQKSKSLTDKLIPSFEICNSDSNQSIDDIINSKNPYIETERSLPCVDIYDSDSNQSEIVKEINADQAKLNHAYEAYSSDSSVSIHKPKKTLNSTIIYNSQHDLSVEAVNLIDNDKYINIDNTDIRENIVMADVTDFTEHKDHGDENRFQSSKRDISKYLSSKMPAILNSDLDFDNLKGKNKICLKRPYSPTTLDMEMEKFYNESWGGENFNHREIQKTMSRDKSLWAINRRDQRFSIRRKTKNAAHAVVKYPYRWLKITT